MKQGLISIMVVFLLSLFSCSLKTEWIDYVDPLIGTGPSTTISNMKHGSEHVNYANAQVIPAVTMPFGMTNWTPQTRETEKKCNAPFYYTDPYVQGFRASHWLSGSCAQDYGSFTIMPVTGELKCSPSVRGSHFDQNSQITTPAYYAVELENYQVKAEMTATTRSAIFRFTFENSDSAFILVDTNSDEGQGFIQIDHEKNEIVGYNPVHRLYQGIGKYAGFKGYFVIKFDKSLQNFGVYQENTPKYKQNKIKDEKNIGGFVAFQVNAGDELLVKAASSFTSIEQARKNLDTEIPHWDFEQVHQNIRDHWNDLLGRYEIKSQNKEDYVKFYTSIYHCYQQPRIVNDVDGTYTGFAQDDNVYQANGYNYFDDFSMWDTYRALHPLYTIMNTKETISMIKSIVLKAEQGGWLPIFPMYNSYTSAMIGDHMISLVGDAYLKGIDDFDVETAYKYMRQNAFKSPESLKDYADGKGRRSLGSYLKYGYVPVEDPVLYAFHKREQSSRTLEYAYDDFVLAEIAQKLGKTDDYNKLLERAQFYKNVYDPNIGYLRGRHENGSWVENADYKKPQKYVTEATPFHYSWYVPHDVAGLIDIMGGVDSFTARLDTFFVETHYWHGNEPSHQVVYMYNFAGHPEKAQQTIRKILKEEYGIGPGGLSGNDDSGQMSAWYLFSVLGFYPVCPGVPEYVIGTPSFDTVNLTLEDGKKFKIVAHNNSDDNCYIESIKLNGKPYNKTFINHKDIVSGGKLEFFMTSDPNTGWGSEKDAVPYSLSNRKQ